MGRTEQRTNTWNVSEERNAVINNRLLLAANARDHDALTVLDGDMRVGLATIDHRVLIERCSRGREIRQQNLDFHVHIVVLRDARSHIDADADEGLAI